MKPGRIIASLLLMGCLMPAAAHAQAPGEIHVMLNGRPVTFEDAQPQIITERTMVPFRRLADALGVQVIWEQETRSIVAVGLGKSVRLVVDSPVMWVNDQAEYLDVPPQIVENRTLVPLRAFSTAFGADVDWDGETRTAYVVSPAREIEQIGFYALGSFSQRQFVPQFSEMIYGWAALTGDGTVDLQSTEYSWPEPAGEITGERLLAEAKSAGVRRDLMITALPDRWDVTNLLQNNSLMEQAADEITRTAVERGFDGVVLDVEELANVSDDPDANQQIRSGFTNLVTMTAQRLHRQGKTLTAAVHPLNSWYEGYDYPALAGQADRLLVMAYDYVPDGQAEPYDSVEDAVQLAVQQVDGTKIILGLSGEGETVDSLAAKAKLARRYGLAGVAYWRLGVMPDAERTARQLQAIEASIMVPQQ